jgi:hypothetical protein
VAKKLWSESEAELKRRQAVEFLGRIGADSSKFEDMSAAQYAESRGAALLPNPSSIRRVAMTKSELAGTLDQLADGLDEALDPELTREELVAKVKELSDLASGEEDEDGPDDDEGDQGDED